MQTRLPSDVFENIRFNTRDGSWVGQRITPVEQAIAYMQAGGVVNQLGEREQAAYGVWEQVVALVQTHPDLAVSEALEACDWDFDTWGQITNVRP